MTPDHATHTTPDPISLNDSNSDDPIQLTSSPHSIPDIVGHNPLPLPGQHQHAQPRFPYRRTIRLDNRAVTALSLPNVMVTNHRSIFPKFNNLVDEILENEMHLGLHSEIWEDKEKAAHAKSIEEALEIHGIQYISTPVLTAWAVEQQSHLLVTAPLCLPSLMYLLC